MWSIIAINIGVKYEKYTQSALAFMPSYFMSKRKSILTNYNGVVSTNGETGQPVSQQIF